MNVLADCLPAVAGNQDWLRPLCSADGWARLAAVASALPDDFLLHQVGFECGLNETATDIDLLVAARAAQGGAALLAATADSAQSCTAHPAWQSLHDLSVLWRQPQWQERLDDWWLEFDVNSATPTAPNLFVGPRIAAGDDAGWREFLNVIAPLLLGQTPTTQLLADFERCRQALPEAAVLFQIGAMRARPGSGLRLCFSHLYLDAMLTYLPRLGIADNEALRQTFIELQPHADGFTLHLDIPLDASPRIGLECYLREGLDEGQRHQRWDGLLDYCQQLGLCASARRQALADYPGRSYASDYPAGQWPQRALQWQSRLPGRSCLHRWLHHIKFDLSNGRPQRAKAYLSVAHEWV